MVSLENIRHAVLARLESCTEGEALDEKTAALIGFSVRASVATLDIEAMEEYTGRALDAGVTAAQIHEALALVSGLGVHSLMEGSRRIALIASQRGLMDLTSPLDELRTQLWDKYVGNDPYWEAMEREAPGFLDSLLRFSPDAFEAFFSYCAVPWKSRALRAVTKELISIAVDASPSHRYLPGLRLHLENAIKLGAGRAAILGTLDIAVAAPLHSGVC